MIIFLPDTLIVFHFLLFPFDHFHQMVIFVVDVVIHQILMITYIGINSFLLFLLNILPFRSFQTHVQCILDFLYICELSPQYPMFVVNDENQEIMENRSHHIAPVQKETEELFIQEVKTHFVLEFISE